jgi:GT2 family glycosyltransferase
MTKNKINISIIIVNYNVRFFLEQCLQSVFDACHNISAEVIVVDNNSHDTSCEMIVNKFPKVKLIANKVNTGFSTANNQGVAIAKGEYVLILNPDTVVTEDTFEKTLQFAKSIANLGTIGIKLIDGTGNFLPESKRGIPTPKVSINKLLGISTKKYYANHLNENESGKIEILVGAFMFMKRDIYNEVKGFDEDYFMYGEDIDLSYKILKKGYNNYYFSEAKIIHYKGESTKKDIKYLNNFYGAMQIFYKKHFKLNPFYDALMNLGIQFWKFIQYFKLNNQKIIEKPINKYIYIGKNEGTFAKIKNILNAELAIYHTAISIENIIANKPDTIIFDNNYITNKEIINTLEILKNKDITFRFIPKSCDFIIGSDNSFNKGNVLKF